MAHLIEYKKRLISLTLIVSFSFLFMFGFLALDLVSSELPTNDNLISDVLPFDNLLLVASAQATTTVGIVTESTGVLDVFIPAWRGYLTTILVAIIGAALFFLFFKRGR